MRLVLAVLLCASISAAASPPAATIDASINKGKAWLYSVQNDGHWENLPPPKTEREINSFTYGQYGGRTALVVYALLTSGESPQDPRLVKAIDFLRKIDMTGVYALGVRAQVWHLLPPTRENLNSLAKDARLLMDAMKTDGPAKGFYDYAKSTGHMYSLSRSQYGVLGVWAGGEAGVEIPRTYWQIVETAWLRAQNEDGGWAYTGEHPSTLGIAAIGIATLYITQDYLYSSDFTGCKGNVENKAITRGVAYMAKNIDVFAPEKRFKSDFAFPTLYSVERIGLAGGLKTIGGIDWFAKGAEWLIRTQAPDGLWVAYADDGYNAGADLHGVPSTSFALLFLSRGRVPVVMNKLDYSSGDKDAPWNQRPRDAANVVRWIGRQLEREFKWQVVSIDSSLDDFHDSSILYIAGSKALSFTAEQKEKLRTFVEQGGLILGNADCGNSAFAESFRKLSVELFPKYEMRVLPEDHLIYSINFDGRKWRNKPRVMGLSNDARELMLLIRDVDAARIWQSHSTEKRESWELATNIYLYATDSNVSRFRGDGHVVKADPEAKPAHKIKVARIEHTANWDPEPAGWQRLANLLRNQHQVDLEIAQVKLAPNSLDGAKIAHLTGTGTFKFDEKVRGELKRFVEAGGTLIIEAAGGSSQFATAAEQEIEKLFPDQKLEMIPADHALFKEMTSIGYRRATKQTLGDARGPRLQAIMLNNRPAAIYSREDLSVSLVGHEIAGIIGYDPATATELMVRIVQSAAGINPAPVAKPQ